MTDCPRLGRLFGGCKFEPRYDTLGATSNDAMVAFWASTSGPVPAPRPSRKTYIADVCVRCGKMLNRRVGTKPSAAKP